MVKKRILVLFGGKSQEHEVSKNSARSVVSQLNKEKYEFLAVAIDRTGKWKSLTSSNHLLLGDNFQYKSKSKDLSITKPAIKGIDVVFPVLHGPYGEDRKIQGMLEMLDLPYIGAGVLASALGMDKISQKKIFAFEGLPVIPWFSFSKYEWQAVQLRILETISRKFHYPLFTKPAELGSSIGITKAHDLKELKEGIRDALLYGNEVIVEQGINAREIECAILGNENPQASLPGEIIPSRKFYDYRAKYLDSKSKLIIPAKASSRIIKKIQDFSLRSFQAIKCSGMARVDFLLEKDTNILYLNEINTIPGFTEISMYAKLWEATGVGYSELLDRLITLAIARYKEKSKREKKAPKP